MRFLIFFLLCTTAFAAANQGTIWRDGATVPANSLGANGDYYLHAATGAVYKKVSGAYQIVANIKGPRGDTGATGSPGSNVPDPSGRAGEFLYSDGTQLVYSKNTAPNPTVTMSFTVQAGQPATLSVNGWGPTPYTFQWSKNGTNIPGATAAVLVFTAMKLEDAATYVCLVSNAHGATATAPCTLTVKP